MFSSALVVASLAASAFGTIFITNPTESTTCTGGQVCSVTWEDNNVAPLLPAWGNASVAIYTGNSLQQTQIQLIVPSVNVSTTGAIQFTVNPSSGANGDFYFIRIQALTLTDPTTNFPEEAFSSKFTLAGMTGTFDASILSEIAGTTTAPIGGGSPVPATGAATTTTQQLVTTTKAATTTSSTAKSTQSASGATRTFVSGAAGIVGFAGAVFGLLL